MRIPDKVKVLGMTYSVEEVECISREEFKLAYIDYLHQKILILKDMSHEKKEQAILHEIFHAVYNALGMDYTDEDNIQRLACVMHQVIKDNESLFP